MCNPCACPVTQLCDPMDCSLPGSSVHGVLQARIVKWVAISFSRGIFPTQGSNLSLAGRFFTTVPPGKPCSKFYLGATSRVQARHLGFWLNHWHLSKGSKAQKASTVVGSHLNMTIKDVETHFLGPQYQLTHSRSHRSCWKHRLSI